MDKVQVPVSKTNPEAGTTQVDRYMLTPPGYPKQLRQYVQTDPGWNHPPGASWQPDLSRYDSDLVDQYRKEAKK